MNAVAGVQRAPAGQCKAAAAPRRPQLRRRPVSAAAAPPAAGSSSSSGRRSAEELAAAVAAKERELAGMFEPGRVAKAAVVAAARRELGELRAALQAELGIHAPAGAAVKKASGPAMAYACPATPLATSFPAATASVLESTVATGGSSASKSVLAALKLVEAQLAVSRDTDVSLAQLSAEQQAELLRLQEENTSLKAQLDCVLARQAQLQQVWDSHLRSTGAQHAAASGSSPMAAMAVNGDAAPAKQVVAA